MTTNSEITFEMDPVTGSASVRFPSAYSNCTVIGMEAAELPNSIRDVWVFFSPWNSEDALQVRQSANLALRLKTFSFNFVLCEEEIELQKWFNKNSLIMERPSLPVFALKTRNGMELVLYHSFAEMAAHLSAHLPH